MGVLLYLLDLESGIQLVRHKVQLAENPASISTQPIHVLHQLDHGLRIVFSPLLFSTLPFMCTFRCSTTQSYLMGVQKSPV